MFSYNAYGLHIDSEVELPPLIPDGNNRAAEVRFRLCQVERRPARPDFQNGCFSASSEEAYFYWKAYGTYRVRNGREVTADLRDADYRLPHIPLLSVLLGVLLHQRGLLTLHASAAVVGGAAVAFVGEKGAGKSTTVAALHARGYPVVADDVVALDLSASEPKVLPGIPRLKLWPEAAAMLGMPPEALSRLHPLLEKRDCPLEGEFVRKAMSLDALYLLTDGGSECDACLLSSPQERVTTLLRHSYAQRFLGKAGATGEHFQQCVELARAIPMYQLRRPKALESLLETAAFIEKRHV